MIEVRLIALFTKWFEKQINEVQEEITGSLNRLRQGNVSNLKLIRGGITELKIHYGKGIRIYMIKKNNVFYIVLWGADSKAQQSQDIEKAVKIKKYMEAQNEN
jgi:putative addiction module killer protein